MGFEITSSRTRYMTSVNFSHSLMFAMKTNNLTIGGRNECSPHSGWSERSIDKGTFLRLSSPKHKFPEIIVFSSLQ